MAALTFATQAIYWFLLPATLIASIILRYNLLSLVYLLFLVVLPYSPQLDPLHIVSWRRFTLTLTFMSGLFLLGHIGFQIALLAHSPYGSLLGDNCSIAESIARYVGFNRFDHVDAGNVIRQLLPDVVVFLVALATYVLIKRVSAFFAVQAHSESWMAHRSKKSNRTKLKHQFLLLVTVIFLSLAGIAHPNVISSLYLLAFIAFVTAWAFLTSLIGKGTVIIRMFISVVTALNLLVLYSYQFHFIQQYIPPAAIYSRLLGLSPIILTDCNAPYKLLFNSTLPWPQYVSPFCILLLHWVLAIGVQMFFRDLKDLNHSALQSSFFPTALFAKRKAGEKSPLVESEDLQQNYETLSSVKIVTEDCADKPKQQESPTTSGTAPAPSGEGVQNSQASALSSDKEMLFQLSVWFSNIRMYSLYVIALIVMMVWSVTYHSWLTFVLLLGSCVLWMLRERARYTLLVSPFLVFYGILLVLLQYVYSLDLQESELPTVINKTNHQLVLSDYGIYRFQYPCLHLGAQLLFVCGFWVVLHQHNLRRKNSSQLAVYEAANRAKRKLTRTDNAVNFIFEQLCKYWIFAVVGCHLAVSSEGSPTGIKIIFMLFFLLNIVTYTISWTLWKRTLTLYWTVLVVYIMIVLMLIYTFQFQNFPDYWKSLTNFTDDELQDLGFVKASSPAELLVMILIPAVFLLFVILQLQYFNKRFLELTKPPSVRDTLPQVHDDIELNNFSSGMSWVKREDESKYWIVRSFDKWKPYLLRAWDEFMSFIMLLLEFHVWKLVFVAVFVAAVYKVSALYAVFVIFWVLLLPFRKTHLFLFVVSSLVAAIIILGIMFYQLQFITADLPYNCSWNFYGTNVSTTYYLTDWFGFTKMAADGAFFFHVEGLIAIVMMIAFERTVFRRQRWLRQYRNEIPSKVTAVFPNITYLHLDNNFTDCVKYMMNYFFYKFGAESCFVMTVIVIWVRTDLFSVAYCLLLIMALCLRRRSSLHSYWRVYLASLMILIIWQYLASLGMPPVWCQHHYYPWLIIGDNSTIRNRLVTWLHLPDYIAPFEIFPSIADFFQLLFVACQLTVFQQTHSVSQFAGSNKYLSGRELDAVTFQTNPKKNFVRKREYSVLDQAKLFVFVYFIWITMAIIFFAGTSRISVYTLGYLLIFFYMVGRQQVLVTGNPSRLLKYFSGFIGYTIAVITLKACLQLAACVYTEILSTRACVFVQFMSLSCARPEQYGISALDEDDDSKCVLLYTTAGFSWDFVCFMFLLIQRRIFASYYFLHVADDMRVALKLAARGAELFHVKFVEAVKIRKYMEEETIDKIKSSMKTIRRSHIKNTLARTGDHMDAIRAGDYYMFDDDSFDPSFSRYVFAEEAIMGPVSMIHRGQTSGISKALKEREKDKKKMSSPVVGEEPKQGLVKMSPQLSRKTDSEDGSASEWHSPELDHVQGTKVTHRRSAAKASTDGPHAHDPKTFPETIDEVDSDDSEDMQDALRGDEGEEDGEDLDSEDKEKKTLWEKVVQAMKFGCELFLSGIDFLTVSLNKQNKDYRNIALQLDAEKEMLAEARHRVHAAPTTLDTETHDKESNTSSNFDVPTVQVGPGSSYEKNERQDPSPDSQKPISDPKTLKHDPKRPDSDQDPTSDIKSQPAASSSPIKTFSKDSDVDSTKELVKEESIKQSPDASAAVIPDVDLDPTSYKDLRAMEFDKDQPRAIRFFYAIWYTIISRTDLVCYFLIILNVMLNPSILSLVLPLSVFLVSTLIIPRPGKRFWTFAIAYIEAVVVFKFIFQFEFWSWNSASEVNMNINNPFWWPRFLGVEQSASWSVMDLLQLLSIFFHASILKVHGLWDDAKPIDRNNTSDSPENSVSAIEDYHENVTSESIPKKESQSSDVEGPARKPSKRESWSDAIRSPFKLYSLLFNRKFYSVTDVYLYMFLCDVINFIIIIFGYDAFGPYAASSIVSNIQANNVPTAFLVMLLIQFVIMILDRAIYLMKNLHAKFVYHFVLVIGIHVWMFFILPSLNQRPFYQNHIAQTYYFFKAVYFLLAAYQIRAGYPKRVSGNFLTKSYGTVNLFLFKGYRIIPFLAEITAIMDWMYTGTSMGISEWMRLWAIHAEVFEIKCWRVFEKAYPTPRGVAKAKWIKYLAGGLLLFFLLAIVWFPLLLMNIAQTIGGITNNPIQVDIKMSLGTFEPVFQVAADGEDMTRWSEARFQKFSAERSSDENAASFLQAFSGEQVVSVNIDGESKTVWIISPPQRELLIQRLGPNNNRSVNLLYEWTITNDPARTSVVTSSGSNELQLEPNSTARAQLYALLSDHLVHGENPEVLITNLVPQYIHSTGSSSYAGPAFGLYSNGSDDYANVLMNIQSLSNRSVANETFTTSWWRVRNPGTAPENPQLNMIVFSNKVSPSSLNFLINYGIIGLYVSIVLVVGRLIRTLIIGSTATIMFTELPYVDRILSLCNDIFLVREEAEYRLEEDLYAKLIFLYRSPKTLIQWTRPKKYD